MNLIKIEGILFYTVIVLYLIATALYFVFIADKKIKTALYAKYAFVLSFVIHTAALVIRGIASGHLPMTNQYEFASSFAWGIGLCYLIFLNRYKFNVLGAFTAPVIILIIGYAAMQNRDIRQLMPALQSRWLAIHVSSSIVAYGSFGVAFALSLIYMLKLNNESSSFWKENVPSIKKLDMMAYRAVTLGFLFLTFCIITGAIWAEQAWGSYWSWDPKETWALITWIIYAIYLHLRITKGFNGRSAAIFAIAGFICVIFTYIGVNTLLPGIHSYA